MLLRPSAKYIGVEWKTHALLGLEVHRRFLVVCRFLGQSQWVSCEVSCTFIRVPRQQIWTFCMKRGGERRDSFRPHDTSGATFPTPWNRNETPTEKPNAFHRQGTGGLDRLPPPPGEPLRYREGAASRGRAPLPRGRGRPLWAQSPGARARPSAAGVAQTHPPGSRLRCVHPCTTVPRTCCNKTNQLYEIK
jgi:hypothetical protein